MPILKGRRISKLRPEFVIMDPKTDSKAGEFNHFTQISKFKLGIFFQRDNYFGLK